MEILMVRTSSSHQFFSLVNIGLVIGINLGESYSQVGVFRNGTFEIIADEHGRSDVPSYVAFQDRGAPLLGFHAKEQASQNIRNTIYDVR